MLPPIINIKKHPEETYSPGLFICRHGATAGDTQHLADDRINGWGPYDLAPDGVRRAQKMSDFLKDKGVTCIVTSDLRRAEHTADIIGGDLKVPVRFDRRARAWLWGSFEGRIVKEVMPIITFHILHRQNVPVAGGESLNEFLIRWRALLGQLTTEFEKGKRGSTAVVTHHTNVKAAIAMKNDYEGDTADKKIMLTNSLPPASILKLCCLGPEAGWKMFLLEY